MAEMKDNNKTGCVFYYDWLNVLDMLPEQEAGKLLLDLLRFGATGEVPTYEDRTMTVLFSNYRMTLQRDYKKYKDTCERNKHNANLRWQREKEHKDNSEGLP